MFLFSDFYQIRSIMSVKQKISTKSLVCYFIIVVIFAITRMLSAFGVFDGLGDSFDYIFNVIIQVVILFGLSVLLFSVMTKNKPRDTFKFFGYKKISAKAVLISIGIGVIVYFLNVFVASFFNVLLALFGYSSSSSSITPSSYPFWLFLVNVLVSAVLPGICEETAHRGLLLKGLSGHGQKTALILSSLLFGLMHMNIDQFFYATLIGFLVGYLALICDSIYPAMIIHFMNNFLSTFAGYSSFNNLGFESIINGFNVVLQRSFILGFLLIAVFVAGLALLLKVLIKMLFKETTVKNMANLQDRLIRQIQKENYLKELEKTAKNEEITEPDSISFEEFDKLYKQNNVELGLMSNLEKQTLNDPPVKTSLFAKFLLAGIFIITAGVTIFTFVWGVL